MSKHIIDDRTIEACQGGDTEAFRLLFEACKDRKRALRRFLSFDRSGARELRAPGKSIEDGYIQRELEASVRAAIAGMKPKLRIAILLKYFEDLSYDEIAGALGCTKGTVASRLN